MAGHGALLVLGGGLDQLAMIERAGQMGYETHVVDRGADAPGRPLAHHFHELSFRDTPALIELAARIRPRGVCTTSEAAVTAVSEVAARQNLVANTRQTARTVSDKTLMRAALRQHGVPCPESVTLTAASIEPQYLQDPAEFVARQGLQPPLVIKPTDRAGALGVRLVTDLRELADAVAAARHLSFSGSVIVERHVQGRQFDVPSLSQNGAHRCLAVIEEYYENPPHFVGRQFLAPAPISSLLAARLRATARAALSAVGVTWGASHCEMRLTEHDEIQVIEVGGRMAGDSWPQVVEHITGHDYLGMTIDVTVGNAVTFDERPYRGALLLRYLYDRSDADTLERLRERHPDRVIDASVDGPPSEGPLVGFHQKFGRFLLSGPDPESCLRAFHAAGDRPRPLRSY